MRLTSYQNLLWIIALLAGLCVAASAQAPPGSTSTQTAVVQTSSLAPHVPTARGGTGETLSASDSDQHGASPTLQAKITEPGQTRVQVETASVLPDSASLLPVAALVGFSFLLGGIVCGTIKNRP